ncbi:Na+/H+ antiporter NhaC family protein [Thalassotalea ponticola]|uniref:Na+/H+ antiporter NhaC family protein n=1 Tax=Thalassotalea ponticola TaxID=1523392 RepID=UPI0025B3D96F|nr:Na+/H+ antiporter NhaC family protein [Thalassotalea ponticola]MDN3653911.1 Na+/H+ antiporter NhaC family protein [Thalassotalea ponticola]
MTLIPPIAAIIIAIWRKNATLALVCGIFLSYLLLSSGQPVNAVTDTFSAIANIFTSTYNAQIIGFSLLIGALIELMNRSGAVQGFINNLASLSLVKTRRQASLLPTIVGTSIFTDTNLSMFCAGMPSQKLFDQHKLSRAKLAFLLDSTCSPISVLFLINGWGAYLLGLLDGYNLQDPVGVLVGTLSYNFYAILAVLFAYYTAYTGKLFGPMAKAEARVLQQATSEEQIKPAKARVMWVPMFILLGLTIALMYVTGNGDIRRGSGAFAVFTSICTALAVLIALIAYYRLLSFKQIIVSSFQGLKSMLPAVTILVLSFAFGDAIKALGTGSYVSSLITSDFPVILIAPLIFLVAGLMAFATGTSWGTFALLIPIAVPIALDAQLPVAFLVAAVLSGGVFGDHASPISDSTVVASIASGCDHFEHVKTQLPYTLVVAALSIIGFLTVGFML